MPRGNRYFLSAHIWHITHRCHKKDFLLKFSRDRQRWLHGLFEAKKRYGLCVLNYVVTSNHIHLLVKDTDGSVIPKWLEQALAINTAERDASWSQSIAVGSASSIERVKRDLGIRAASRKLIAHEAGHSIREMT